MGSKGESSVLVPRIHKSVLVAEGTRIYGDVEIRANASVWFNAVIRGDEGKIVIGTGTNIQDNAVLHSDMGVGVEMGSPAKRIRELTEEEMGGIEIALAIYRDLVDKYLRKEILGFRR